MKKVYETAYICDGTNPKCSGKPGCYYRKDGRHGPCMHTQDKRYAKNKKLDPKKNRDAFDKFSYGDVVRYYEKTSKS